jgi:peptidyl-prolyl cis-trans isomerase B (cyclophilin B)
MLKILFVLAASALFALPAFNADSYPVGRIQTDKGEILFYLYPQTPNHQASFITLANQHYFDSLTFNRVIKNFVAQGGCPDTPEGFAGSPYNLAPEFNDSLRHVYGAVGAGRDDNPGKLSAGCQLYIVANKNGLARLDGNYTVYGQVIKGMDVVETIVSVPTDSTDAPLVPIKLQVDIVEMTAAQLEGYGFEVTPSPTDRAPR